MFVAFAIDCGRLPIYCIEFSCKCFCCARGSFPQEYVQKTINEIPEDEPFVPLPVAILFHCVSAMVLLLELIMAMSWVFILITTSGVSPDGFHKFYQQIEYIQNSLLRMGQTAAIGFVLDIGILFSCHVYATLTNTLAARILGLAVPVLVVIPSAFVLHSFVSYVGRVAFHGILLPDSEIPETMKNATGKASEAEEQLCRSFFRSREVSDDTKVLDLCLARKATQVVDRKRVSMTGRRIYFGQDVAIPKYQEPSKEKPS